MIHTYREILILYTDKRLEIKEKITFFKRLSEKLSRYTTTRFERLFFGQRKMEECFSLTLLSVCCIKVV